VFGTQILLGIATIWSGMDIWLAVAHQFTGALLVATTVWGAHVLGSKDPIDVAGIARNS
jgi:cytochrome c oxidase assembly protein subunit 15